jgi:hypothetical protein
MFTGECRLFRRQHRSLVRQEFLERLHALEAPPAAREGCGDCGKLEEIRGLLA